MCQGMDTSGLIHIESLRARHLQVDCQRAKAQQECAPPAPELYNFWILFCLFLFCLIYSLFYLICLFEFCYQHAHLHWCLCLLPAAAHASLRQHTAALDAAPCSKEGTTSSTVTFRPSEKY